MRKQLFQLLVVGTLVFGAACASSSAAKKQQINQASTVEGTITTIDAKNLSFDVKINNKTTMTVFTNKNTSFRKGLKYISFSDVRKGDQIAAYLDLLTNKKVAQSVVIKMGR